MLSLLADLKDIWIGFNLFNYVSFRTGGAICTAFLISLMMGPRMIAWLKSLQGAGQPIRSDGPETHFKKAGTPTMGGGADINQCNHQHNFMGAFLQSVCMAGVVGDGWVRVVGLCR